VGLLGTAQESSDIWGKNPYVTDHKKVVLPLLPKIQTRRWLIFLLRGIALSPIGRWFESITPRHYSDYPFSRHCTGSTDVCAALILKKTAGRTVNYPERPWLIQTRFSYGIIRILFDSSKTAL
tara:strand:- start:4292 stop:4660 length:369 start_codon:yes stop_codon:yes gene_type:complete